MGPLLVAARIAARLQEDYSKASGRLRQPAEVVLNPCCYPRRDKQRVHLSAPLKSSSSLRPLQGETSTRAGGAERWALSLFRRG